MSDIENSEGTIVEAARTLLGLGPDNEDVDTLDRVRELRRKSAGYDALVRVIAALAENDSLVDGAITAAEGTGCPAEVVDRLRNINDAMFRRRLRKGETGFASGSKLESLFARFMPMLLEEQTKGDVSTIARSDADDGMRDLVFETDGLLKSLESAEVGGWTLPDPSDTRAGSHTIVKVNDGHLSVIQAGQHRSWILKARELSDALRANRSPLTEKQADREAISVLVQLPVSYSPAHEPSACRAIIRDALLRASRGELLPTVTAILDALQSGIDHAPDAHWRAEPCGPIVSTAVDMMLRVPGLEQQNRELHQALAKRKTTSGRFAAASNTIRDDAPMRATLDEQAHELARVLAHIATLPPWCAPTPPPGMRPAALGGECARCLARPGYHEGSCIRRMAPSVETLFAKWAPLLSPYLNDEQLANLHNDIALAVGANRLTDSAPVSDTVCASKTASGDVVGEALRGAAQLVHRIINDVPPPRWPFDLVPLRDLIGRAEHVRGPLPTCCARAETAERRLAELRSGIEALRARLQAAAK